MESESSSTAKKGVWIIFPSQTDQKRIFLTILFCSQWYFLSLILLIHCTQAASQPSAEKHLFREIPDLSYCTGQGADSDKHKLDLYLPLNIKNYPTILWIHGGAWSSGGRKQEAEMARRFAEKGIGMIVIDYRLSTPQEDKSSTTTNLRHPGHIQDCVRALHWAIENGTAYGIDIQKIVVSGYSSGAHLSALLVTDRSYLAEAGLDTSALLGSVPIAGAYDLMDYYQTLITTQGPEKARSHIFTVFVDLEAAKNASPSSYIHESTLPMLVISELSTYKYAKHYEKSLTQAAKNKVVFFHDLKNNHHTLYECLKDKAKCDTRERIIEYVLKISQNN